MINEMEVGMEMGVSEIGGQEERPGMICGIPGQDGSTGCYDSTQKSGREEKEVDVHVSIRILFLHSLNTSTVFILIYLSELLRRFTWAHI